MAGHQQGGDREAADLQGVAVAQQCHTRPCEQGVECLGIGGQFAHGNAPTNEQAAMQAGAATDRLHISFHSNAGGGRGTVALISSSSPTLNQTALAQLCGNEVNDDLVNLGTPPLELAWNDRSTVTYSGSYSEISNTNFVDEMAATIIEVGFHDQESDAKLLRDPKVRLAVAKASMQAVVRYMNTYAGAPLAFLPDAPQNLRTSGTANGSVTLNWSAPVSVGGSGTPTGYVVYRSSDGRGFGNPVVLGNVTTTTLTGLPTGTALFFRVAATNAARQVYQLWYIGDPVQVGDGEGLAAQRGRVAGVLELGARGGELLLARLILFARVHEPVRDLLEAFEAQVSATEHQQHK